jgi:hypothetical protein
MIRSACLSLALAALSFSGLALAQQGMPAQQSREDQVRVTAFPKGVFRLSSGRVVSTVNLKAQLSGCSSGLYDASDPKSRPAGGEADTRVVDLVKKGGAWYLTFGATLQGGCNVQGMCGAGTDTTLVWLKLTPALRVIARQAAVVENCSGGLGVTSVAGKPGDTLELHGLELSGGLLNVVSVKPNFDKKIDILTTVRYRHAAPEKGLSVSSRQVAQK